MADDFTLEEVCVPEITQINKNFLVLKNAIMGKNDFNGAKLNGDSKQVFNVADAIELTQAVSKSQLDAAVLTVNTTISALKNEIDAINLKVKEQKVFITDFYPLSTSANTIINHNLGLKEPLKALALPIARVKTAVAGYSAGDIISDFIISTQAITFTSNNETLASGTTSHLNLDTNTVTLPRCFDKNNCIYSFNKNTGIWSSFCVDQVEFAAKIYHLE